MGLVQQFQDHIKANNLFSAKDKLLLAVSGGVDSVVLCELCKQAGYDFSIAHCNFQLRGEESNRDEQFVNGLAKKYGVEIFVKKFDTDNYASENKLSTQEAARDLRYTWFAELIETQDPKPGTCLPDRQARNFLVTAHHADDNNETLLMNFFRGTGLHGLTGIPDSAGFIRRPLLGFSKEELIAFATENKLEFVEDSSNQSSKYTRNFFRNEIIPAISKAYPQVKENLKGNINRFKEIEKLYRFSVGELTRKLCRKKGNEVHVPVKQLMGFNNWALIYEIISAYGFNEKQVEEVVKLAESNSGKYILSPSVEYRIIKHRHWLIISPVLAAESENIIIDEGVTNLQTVAGNLQIRQLLIANCKLPTDNYVACLDLKEIRFPLLLRKWKQGDYFYPLGMKKKKKLSRFFIDQKLSKSEKDRAWVIESDKRIIWVVGQRIDERCKLTDKTKQVLQISLLS